MEGESPLKNHKSPRSFTRKFNKIQTPEYLKAVAEGRIPVIKKREQAPPENDPPYSSEEEDEDDPPHLHFSLVPGYQCSAHLIPDVMKQLTVKQRGWVKNIEFGALQDMIESRVPESLAMWLVDRVNTDDGTVEVCGIPVDIRNAVRRILKLPSGKIKVPHPLNGSSKAKRGRGHSCHPDQKYSDLLTGQTAKDATKSLLKETEDEAEFCRSFVLLVLCIYLAPTTSLNINRNYYSCLMDVSKIKLMDWCGFIADYLIQGIKEYRNSKASHIQVPGCVHILPLLYIDALIEFKALTFPETLTLPEGEPRIHFIGTEHLDYLASVDVKSSSMNQVEYGLLQDSFNSFESGPSPYNPIQVEYLKRHRKNNSTPSFVAKKGDFFSKEDSCPLPSNSRGISEEHFVADMFSRLSNEISQSRHELLQGIHQKIEVADQNHRIFVNQIQSYHNLKPMADNFKRSTS